MKKITWTIAAFALYLSSHGGFAQTASNDTSTYKTRKLKVDEVNLVSVYYQQNGNLSPVTGGIGSEKLTDIETSIDLKLIKRDKKDRRHTLLIDAGISYYTSASSDKIDPSTVSSASSKDVRYFPSVSYTVDNENKGIAVGANVAYSKEFDYASYGYGLNFTKTSKDKNSDLSVKLNAFNDVYTIIRPIEFRDPSTAPPGIRQDFNYSTQPRNSYDVALVFSHVINKRLQMALLGDIAYQSGFLSTPFHRVYFSDDTEGLEELPSTHLKIPVGVRFNAFLGDRFLIRSYYRYYQDDWSLKSHTANVEVPIKITPFVSISPFYRFYVQSAVDYFAPYKQNNALSTYHTTDDDLSAFTSNFLGAGIRFSPAKGIFGIKRWNMLELRYGFYKRSDGLVSHVVSMNLKFR